ncbi:MAG: response regulator transcription factor [Lachnospiraceae bacterium]|nr:response regulator transcription factor [Lachnospiraceae bacterium]
MIYCVEDDDSIRNLVVYTLTASGFEARGFADAASFWEAADAQIPRLVLLDIMLPDEDGITILTKIRSHPKTSCVPVIMATARGTEYDKVIGLDLGADDYLAKPFGMMEMVSRVRAVLRRGAVRGTAQTLQIGGLTLNPQQHAVLSGGESVTLTLKEYELLKLLMENPGIVFTREQLMARIWGDDFLGESRTVDVHIGTLRTKLGSCGSCIETVRGVGYKMEKPA